MKKYLVILMILVLTSTQTLFSQDHRWQLTLADGKLISKVGLHSLFGDSLVVTGNNTVLLVEVGQIREIRLVKVSKLEEGVEIGAGVGTVFGAVYYLATYKEKSVQEPTKSKGWEGIGPKIPDLSGVEEVLGTLGSALVGGLAGAIVGTVIGAVSSSDEVYDLSQLSLEAKLTSISKILAEQQSKLSINKILQ